MSKVCVVLFCVCTCAMAASVIRSPKLDKKLKAVSVLTEGQVKLLRAAGPKENAVQVDHSTLASANGDQVLGQYSTTCSNGGWYIPCDGKCYVFTGINSLVLLGSRSHTIALFEYGGCTGSEYVYSLDTNVCYDNVPYVQSGICF